MKDEEKDKSIIMTFNVNKRYLLFLEGQYIKMIEKGAIIKFIEFKEREDGKED